MAVDIPFIGPIINFLIKLFKKEQTYLDTKTEQLLEQLAQQLNGTVFYIICNHHDIGGRKEELSSIMAHRTIPMIYFRKAGSKEYYEALDKWGYSKMPFYVAEHLYGWDTIRQVMDSINLPLNVKKEIRELDLMKHHLTSYNTNDFTHTHLKICLGHGNLNDKIYKVHVMENFGEYVKLLEALKKSIVKASKGKIHFD